MRPRFGLGGAALLLGWLALARGALTLRALTLGALALGAALSCGEIVAGSGLAGCIRALRRGGFFPRLWLSSLAVFCRALCALGRGAGSWSFPGRLLPGGALLWSLLWFAFHLGSGLLMRGSAVGRWCRWGFSTSLVTWCRCWFGWLYPLRGFLWLFLRGFLGGPSISLH